MVDPGEGPRGPRLPLVLDQTGAPKSEKKNGFLRLPPPPPHFSQGLDDQAPPLSEGLDLPLLIAVSNGGTWVNFCWVCAAGLPEPLPHYSLFCGQLWLTPSWVPITFGQICNFRYGSHFLFL